MRIVERTKQCRACGQVKPWSEFYATKRWDDGTMRVPTSKCRPCSNAYRSEHNRLRRRADPEWARARDRDHYRRLRADPERWGVHLEQNRVAQARRLGYKSRREVSSRLQAELVPVGPFADWLRLVLARDGLGILATARNLRIPDRVFRRFLNGEQERVDLATVERALIADDTASLRDVYPDLYSEAA